MLYMLFAIFITSVQTPRTCVHDSTALEFRFRQSLSMLIVAESYFNGAYFLINCLNLKIEDITAAIWCPPTTMPRHQQLSIRSPGDKNGTMCVPHREVDHVTEFIQPTRA